MNSGTVVPALPSFWLGEWVRFEFHFRAGQPVFPRCTRWGFPIARRGQCISGRL